MIEAYFEVRPEHWAGGVPGGWPGDCVGLEAEQSASGALGGTWGLTGQAMC